MTNKKLAFYVGLILAGLVFALLILDIVTLAQAQLALVTIGMACIPFGAADVIFDYLNIMVKVGEIAAAATPSLEDDKKVAEFKQIIETVRNRIEAPVTSTAIDKTVTAPFTTTMTPIAGTNVSFYTPVDETDAPKG